MNEETALKQRVIEKPWEDGPRLEFAAWCERAGDRAQGEFIRAQVARAQVHWRSEEAQRLFQEEMRALWGRTKGTTWWGDFEAVLRRYRERTGKNSLSMKDVRGFVGGYGGDLADVVAVAAEMFRTEPIERLWVGAGSREEVERLAGMKELQQVRVLGMPADAELLRALGASAHARNIGRLTIYPESGKEVGAEVVEALIAALGMELRGVRKLEMHGVQMGAAEVARIGNAGSGWQRLAIEEAGIGDAGAQALAEAPIGGVTELWLRENGITAAGVEALVHGEGTRGVRDLDLGKNAVEEAGMRAIQQRRGMPALEWLGVEEAVHALVYEEWTDWTGANLGGDHYERPVDPADVAKRWPVTGVKMYGRRVGD